jgi:hypothetical protein
MHRQPVSDLHHACGRISLHRQCPSPQDTSLLDAVAQALRGGEGYQRVGAGMRRRDILSALAKDSGKELCMAQTGGLPAASKR